MLPDVTKEGQGPIIPATLMRAAAAVIVPVFLLAACGVGTSNTSPQGAHGTSPAPSPAHSSPSAAPAPGPLAQSFGVLATQPQPGEPIQITLVGTDGQVKAGTSAQPRTSFSCADATPILPAATVSTTDSRLYYLDGDTTVRFLSPRFANDLEKGEATRVPGGGQVASTFTVSPDDRRIAVVATDYSKSPPAFRIYVEDLAGGANHTEIFSGDGSHGVPWAVGWHSGQIVLGYTGGCIRAGGPFSTFPFEYHLVDATTAVRSATLGTQTGCHAVSLPSAAGVLCLEPGGRTQVLGWDGRSQRQFAAGDAPYFNYSLSPSGMSIGACCETSGATTVEGVSSQTYHVAGSGTGIGFIDDQHLLIGAPSRQSQARVFVLGGAGTTIPVAAIGEFVARLPGGLDPRPGT